MDFNTVDQDKKILFSELQILGIPGDQNFGENI